MAQILGGQQPQQPKIDLSQAQDLNCVHCGGEYFISAVMVKKISKFVTGTANDAVLPVDVLLCGNCGKPLEDLLPKEFRKHTAQTEPQPEQEEPKQESSLSLEL